MGADLPTGTVTFPFTDIEGSTRLVQALGADYPGVLRRHTDGYVGLDVHRAARIANAAHGGQVIISDATRAPVEDALPPARRIFRPSERRSSTRRTKEEWRSADA